MRWTEAQENDNCVDRKRESEKGRKRNELKSNEMYRMVRDTEIEQTHRNTEVERHLDRQAYRQIHIETDRQTETKTKET